MRKIVLVFLTVICCLLLSSCETEDVIKIQKNASETSSVNGDAVFICLETNLNTDVSGDFLSASVNTRQSGTVEGDMRIVSLNATISGGIYKNISAVLANGNFTDDFHCRKNLYLTGNDIVISGEIDGNLYAFASPVTIKGVVKGNVYIRGNLTVDSNAKIYGDIICEYSRMPAIPENSHFGNLEYKEIKGKPTWRYFAFFIFSSFITILLYFIIKRYIPEKKNTANPMPFIWRGSIVFLLIVFCLALILFLMPVLFILSSFLYSLTFFIAILGFAVILYFLSFPIICSYIGNLIYKDGKRTAQFFVGFSVVQTLYLCFTVLTVLGFNGVTYIKYIINLLIFIFSLGKIYLYQKKPKNIKKRLAKDDNL